MPVATSNWNSECGRRGKRCGNCSGDAAQSDRAGDWDAFALDQPSVEELGHEVIVANARKVRLIGESRKKDDRLDAQTLARLATIAPWEIWASHVAGHWIFLCTSGPNVLIDGLTFGTERGLPQIALPEGARALVVDTAAHYPQLKSTSSIAHFMLNKMRETPTAVLELLLVKAMRSWFANESHTLEGWSAIIQLLYLPFLLLGIRTVRKYGDAPQRNFALLAVAVTAYFWTMTTVTAVALLRYMVPATCLLAMFVAISLEFLSTRFIFPKVRIS